MNDTCYFTLDVKKLDHTSISSRIRIKLRRGEPLRKFQTLNPKLKTAEFVQRLETLLTEGATIAKFLNPKPETQKCRVHATRKMTTKSLTFKANYFLFSIPSQTLSFFRHYGAKPKAQKQTLYISGNFSPRIRWTSTPCLGCLRTSLAKTYVARSKVVPWGAGASSLGGPRAKDTRSSADSRTNCSFGIWFRTDCHCRKTCNPCIHIVNGIQTQTKLSSTFIWQLPIQSRDNLIDISCRITDLSMVHIQSQLTSHKKSHRAERLGALSVSIEPFEHNNDGKDWKCLPVPDIHICTSHLERKWQVNIKAKTFHMSYAQCVSFDTPKNGDNTL